MSRNSEFKSDGRMDGRKSSSGFHSLNVRIANAAKTSTLIFFFVYNSQ